MTDPSIAEVVRRLDDVTRSVERVARTLEESYVRREVYEAKHEAIRSSFAREDEAIRSYAEREFNDVRTDIAEIRADRASDKAFRRQIMAGASVGLILLLVNLVLATSNFMARVGG